MSKVVPDTYEQAEVIGVQEDTATVAGVDKCVLRVRCRVPDGNVEGTIFLEELLKEGKPSRHLKALWALGLNDAQIGAADWQPMMGHHVTVVVENNAKNYPEIKYFNDPDGGPAVPIRKPPAASTKARLRKQMQQMLAQLSGARPAPAPAPTEEGSGWGGGEERLPGERPTTPFTAPKVTLTEELAAATTAAGAEAIYREFLAEYPKASAAAKQKMAAALDKRLGELRPVGDDDIPF